MKRYMSSIAPGHYTGLTSQEQLLHKDEIIRLSRGWMSSHYFDRTQLSRTRIAPPNGKRYVEVRTLVIEFVSAITRISHDT